MNNGLEGVQCECSGDKKKNEEDQTNSEMCKRRTSRWNKWDGSKVIMGMIVEQGIDKRNDDQLKSKHGEKPHH